MQRKIPLIGAVGEDSGTVGIGALHRNASQVVRRAKAGEIITITVRGEPVAQLEPIEIDRHEQAIDDGLITPVK